jgi:hypothetical protein
MVKDNAKKYISLNFRNYIWISIRRRKHITQLFIFVIGFEIYYGYNLMMILERCNVIYFINNKLMIDINYRIELCVHLVCISKNGSNLIKLLPFFIFFLIKSIIYFTKYYEIRFWTIFMSILDWSYNFCWGELPNYNYKFVKYL